MPTQTILNVLKEYVLNHDLAPETEDWYRRIVGVFCTWTSKKNGIRQRFIPRSRFTPELVSKFLQAKQQEGRSSHYRKSLRNGFRALLNFDGKKGPVRTVALVPLEPDAWNEEEVSLLVEAVPRVIMPRSTSPRAQDRRWFHRSIIPAAWYTGLGRCDLARLDQSHVSPEGVVRTRRSKTSKKSITRIPPWLVREFYRQPGPVFQLRTSKEYFRIEFAKIAKAAGLKGTFKKLRGSSGTAVELKHPGRGHEHLANTRPVFEAHYLASGAVPAEPLSPPELPGATCNELVVAGT